MKKFVWLLMVAVAALLLWSFQRKSEPPAVPFAKAKRETLVSTLSTNGKVEPAEWQEARAEVAGTVTRVPVQEGQTVAAAAVLAVLTDPARAAESAAAAARVAEAQAALDTVDSGGKAAELAAIANDADQARLARTQAQRELDSLERLLAKQAATGVEVAAARAKVEQAGQQAAAAERRRAALVGASDRVVAEARLRDAEAALALIRNRASQMQVRSPLAGTVYQLTVRPGAYLAVGDAVANVGRFDRLHVRVYVDEPELGRVAVGQPVVITWDALPGRQWAGSVERMPSAVQALGTRQVGEVVCHIENPGRELIPGTNVNAALRVAVAENALTVPKEVMRRDAQGAFVYLLTGDTIERRAVETGASSIARFQVASGLREGDAVALPTDVPLRTGLKVAARYP